MAAENNQSPVGPSPLCSPSTSQQSTHTFSSEEEDAEGETESLKEEASFSKEDEFLGENGYYPEEDEYLEEEEVPREEDYLYPHDRLHEDQYWKWREYLQKKASLKGQGYLYENDYPESRENLQKKVGSRERDYLYENVYLEEEEYLQKEAGFKERDYPYENDYLKSRENLQRGVGLKEQDYLYENDYLGGEFEVASTSQTQPKFNIRDLATPGTSQVTTLFAVPTPVSEAASEPHYDLVPLASFTKDGREFLIWKDQSTQTEWFYKTEAPLKLELETELESSHLDSEVYIITEMPEEENEVTATGSGEDLVDSTENEPADLLDIEDISDSFLKSFSYQAVFKAVVRELTARNEQEEDIDIPLTAPLEGENRRKLGILLKKNFEKFKEIILWIMKKRENLLNPKAIGIPTITYRFGSQLSEDKEPERQEEVKEPERQEVKKPRQIVRRKKLEIDTEWIKNKTEVHQDNAKLDFYPDESIFQILFPDGSGQIHYPSGNLALLILSSAEGKFTYIVLEDSRQMQIQALVNNAGHATFHNENREIWLSLSPNLGYYFAKDHAQKAWNWWNLREHVHAPPVQPVCLRLNRHIEVHVRSQDTINFCFTHQKNHVCLNLGTKYKFLTPEMLSEMKNQAALEVDAGALARRARVLLGKMSRLVNFLTIPDLENFLEAASILLTDNMKLPRKFRARVEEATTLVYGSFSSYYRSGEGRVVRGTKRRVGPLRAGL
ncbi:glutamate-rich protein 6B [Rousettus aegyptiacus]|uniref:Glutamate rich 6B n=2 Tax=Rousettus aegyptiacus TaxID=9407 RepID=A0A7J8DWU8_ROUAE|nr:glutamate-rich protein 6B [Rousettus aegyptiacus]XP_015999335.2 glutamate-rich protein 6B [Rousettus aegyptiacus]KAF6427489.1 glutamate rich 6B [Rousettus aegyptiacus]